jgi:hypothetical protein
MSRKNWLLNTAAQVFCLFIHSISCAEPVPPVAGQTEAGDAKLTLAEGGKSGYMIVLSKEASASEKHAGAELAKFLFEISGAQLPVVTEGETLPERMIVIGDGEAFRSLKISVDLAKLGDEGFAIKSSGPHLAIVGGRLRGTLYGVYTFLEETLGCRWYTSTVSYIPKMDVVTIGPLKIAADVPDFEYREPFYTDAWDPDWAARNKVNGHHPRLDETRGGKVSYFPFVHTFDTIVPKAVYFAEHPEYFSLIDGVRRGGQYEGQLCLTNPDVQRIGIETVMRWMDENPSATIFSVSMNDNVGYCRCEKCAAVDAEEESPCGSVLRFVNAIAAEAAIKHPGKLVDTIAYQYTEKTPKITRPLPNVRVRICPIFNCQHHPYEQRCCPNNAAFMDNLANWDKVTDSLYIWHYNTNFANYLLPLPDLEELAADIPLYKRSGVKGVFMQGTYNAVQDNRPTGGGGFMDNLKQYLIAKMLWNTKADAKAICADFLNGFFGQSAKPIGDYLDLLHDKVRNDNIHAIIYTSPADSRGMLTPEIVAKCDQLFDEAERVADNADILARVKHARLSLEYFKVMEEARQAQASGTAEAKAEALRKMQDFAARCKADGIVLFTEGGTVDAVLAGWTAALKPAEPAPAPAAG